MLPQAQEVLRALPHRLDRPTWWPRMTENVASSKLFFGPWYRKSPYFEAIQRDC